jgi:thioredoxin reductase (NADPH)
LRGQGVSTCATCDGPLFGGRVVGVVGGGDSAFQEALTLAQHVAKVIVFHRGDTFRAQAVYQQRARGEPRIQLRPRARIDEILGESRVTGVLVRDLAADRDELVDLAGVFGYAGLVPNVALLGHLVALDGGGHIPTDVWLRTARPGLFAAGDVRQHSAAQAITSAGDGAVAAIAAHRYLAGEAWPGA